MPAINFNSTLLRLIKDVNDIRSALRRVTVNLPLFDIANENTPLQLLADQNNYVIGNYDVLRLTSDTPGRTITGLKGGIKGRFLHLFNFGDYEILFSHQDTSSNAENRIISPTGFNMILNPGGEIRLYYDVSKERWISSYNSNADRISAELQISAAQSISNASYEQISWNVVVKDTGHFYDPLNPTYITIPETGWYQTTLHIAWDINGTNFRECLLERNIVGLLGNISFDSRKAVTGASTNIELARLVYLNEGETIYATVWQNSLAALNVNVNGPRGAATTLVISKM